MKYYLVEPEVPGGFGDGTVLDRSGPYLKVTKLHYRFDGWLGDDFLTSHPIFFATRRLAEEVKLNKLTGVALSNMEASPSEIFEAFHPGHRLPEFIWLKIDGKPGSDDFRIVGNGKLIISAKALAVLRSFNLNYCRIAPYPSPAR